jgi:hypothetical protein
MAVKKVLKKTKPATTVKAAAPSGESGTYEGYCVKCKEKGVKYEGKVEVSKSGMNMAKGPCPTCGTTICRILGKAAS